MFLIALLFSLYTHVFFSPEEFSMSASDKRYFQHTLHYFPSVENDASRITWAHAVNSREKLEEALKSELNHQTKNLILRFLIHRFVIVY